MNKKNLEKLAKYLLSNKLEAGFSMDNFFVHNGCNSVACAIGHAPFAGIQRIPSEPWGCFSSRTLIPLSSRGWDWCFDSEWESVDNTPEGAAMRILYLLKNGLPNNWRLQMSGIDPLEYWEAK